VSIRVALHHRTTYRYDKLIQLGPQVVRLRPAPHSRTPVTSYSLKITPADHFINWQQDPQSNYMARLIFNKPTRLFEVVVDFVAEMTVVNPFDFFLEPQAEEYPFSYDPSLAREIAPFLFKVEPGPLLRHYLATANKIRRRTIDFLVDLNFRLHKDISYTIRLEPGVQTPEQTLELRSGSCRDSAWLLVQMLRHLGLAARFVSGYLIQLKPDQKSLDGPSGTEVDFTDLHAWCEVYLPGAGWVGMDPTSGLFAGEGHIPVAATPDPQSAAPISGMVDPAEVEFEHEMKVTRIFETPRVTKPYSDDQWGRIEALGHQIDEELRDGDVRLTLGGEPTFVSIDDMEGAEWNTAAVGPSKRKLAENLIRRLRDRYAPGGLLHFGQGKWYPGEQLPRWALSCYWRKDGIPIWQNQELICDERKQYHYTKTDAKQFVATLSARLGVSPSYAAPAYEDPVHFLHREGALPVNVDPTDSRLKDAEERERLRRVFKHGLSEPVGYVLPIQRGWSGEERVWQSGLWMLRSKHLVLIPGDSAIGLRLPLAALPWVEPAQYPHVHPTDPFAPRQPLPAPMHQRNFAATLPSVDDDEEALREVTARRKKVLARGGVALDVEELTADVDRLPLPGESASWVVRTALCVEPRNGRLHVFMPPLPSTEDYLELVTAIEDTAEALNIPVILEGELPPFDPRVNLIKVTPDPGVIEVNTQPCKTWDELVKNTTALYEEARLSRLGTEKFMLDGRHTGTGGGNHVVVGGPTPADSPFLRRPDLLRSLIAYWLNHPSLSYLFCGMFIGPTSQAPRIDEARHDSLYELDIAFQELDAQLKRHGTPQPWLVDRLFRHLLVDVSGNTHRSEFCIDKLFSPDSSSGRLGLVEFRAFEMPPHARMSLTQQLLLRALIARFWTKPYAERPIRWGTQLHDRFMLPHYVWQDFTDVIGDMNRAGYPMQAAWFAPHFEFRFPLLGQVQHAGIELELRQALEPWHVLGEEGSPGGTARYVDSSLERVEIKASNLLGSRHIITCNGRQLPLRATGVHAQFVAGIRYRAWQPPSCLHPTIGVDSPLVFDIIDTWNSRSIGGCTYHVVHPGGRSYATFPINAMEAESRRSNRFFPYGHTPGVVGVPTEQPNPEFPYTLDMRRKVM
jgi:uncharacterized protein (DUF2126 family)